MAAGLATLQQLTTEAFAHLENLSERLCNGLNGLFEEDAFEAQAVHNGAVFSIHFTKDELINYRSIAAADKTMSYPIFLSLLEEGYLLSYGMAMNSISLPTRERDIDGLIAAFGRVIRNMKGASR
jgi:glutamate-1-semialdehyde 2,1-aminomutase